MLTKSKKVKQTVQKHNLNHEQNHKQYKQQSQVKSQTKYNHKKSLSEHIAEEGKTKARDISRVLYLSYESSCHLSRRQVTLPLQQPTLQLGRAALRRRFTWSCNPWRVRLRNIAARTVGSYPAFSPLPHKNTAVILCYADIPSRRSSTFRSTALCVARTFLRHLKMTATGLPCHIESQR